MAESDGLLFPSNRPNKFAQSPPAAWPAHEFPVNHEPPQPTTMRYAISLLTGMHVRALARRLDTLERG